MSERPYQGMSVDHKQKPGAQGQRQTRPTVTNVEWLTLCKMVDVQGPLSYPALGPTSWLTSSTLLLSHPRSQKTILREEMQVHSIDNVPRWSRDNVQRKILRRNRKIHS